MKIVLLIVAIIVMINHCMNAHVYKTDYYKFTKKEPFYSASKNKFAWFVGSLVSFAIEAAACWYAIDYFVKL